MVSMSQRVISIISVIVALIGGRSLETNLTNTCSFAALHELEPKFRALSLSDAMKRLACDLEFKDPRVLQSMLIFKQPKIGGEVPPHQDSTFLYTEPLSARGFWFALEDCTAQNGALSFAPGSHKSKQLKVREYT